MTIAGELASGDGAQVTVIVAFAALGISFWVLQIVQHAKYQEMAENNHQRTLALRAPRGILFRRHGKVLVENRPPSPSPFFASTPKILIRPLGLRLRGSISRVSGDHRASSR